MRIELDIPDWATDQTIRIISGLEMVAYKDTKGYWQVKEIRCQRCGECCKKENCDKLSLQEVTAVCERGLSMPFHCLVALPCYDAKYQNKCLVQYKEIK